MMEHFTQLVLFDLKPLEIVIYQGTKLRGSQLHRPTKNIARDVRKRRDSFSIFYFVLRRFLEQALVVDES